MPRPPTKKLLEGEIDSVEMRRDTIAAPVTKLMKVVSITRKPGGRIATLEMMLKGGPVVLEIDEATAAAIQTVFDADAAEGADAATPSGDGA